MEQKDFINLLCIGIRQRVSSEMRDGLLNNVEKEKLEKTVQSAAQRLIAHKNNFTITRDNKIQPPKKGLQKDLEYLGIDFYRGKFGVNYKISVK